MTTKRISARDVIDAITDKGSVTSWDKPIDISNYEPEYRNELEKARERSGCDESILTGEGTLNGKPVAFIVNEFSFLAGSIGRHATNRIVAAIERATAEGLPLFASTSSGGTRMQEGTPAFVGMVDISRAIMKHRKSGLPYFVHLRHPTTGGVFASWGSLGHVTVAEPAALTGFLGPKVYELLNGEPFPAGVQVSENLVSNGLIDATITFEQLPQVLDNFLTLLSDERGDAPLSRRGPIKDLEQDVWASITHTRVGKRAGVRDVLNEGSDITIELHGNQEGERDDTVLLALARIDGVPCVVVGQDRDAQSNTTPMGPSGLRQARRGMRLAQELDLPFVSFIDTPGAELSKKAEESGMAGEIARCLANMSTLTVPTISVLLGQGTGGGALALFPAKVTIAAQHSWMSPLPPEGASAIMFGNIDSAPDLAKRQKVSAIDLHNEGIVHHLVAEFENDTPADLARAVAAEVGHWLHESTRQ